jgi:hypothetical protein
VKYTTAKNKVVITCKLHGDYEQTPNAHINNEQGCTICKSLERANNKQLKFITKANKIHNNKYDYTKTKYIHSNQAVVITCPLHGDFHQTPSCHVNKMHGCKMCGIKGGYNEIYFQNYPSERNVMGIFYKVLVEYAGVEYFKIGITQKSVKVRFNSSEVNLVKCIEQIEMPLYEAFQFEQQMLIELRRKFNQPTVRFNGHTECFIV